MSLFKQDAKRVREYYDNKGWTLFKFQRDAWTAFNEGKSGLIHSPTGTGKTLSAFLGPVIRYLRNTKDVKANQGTEPLQVLWITPLRALAADTEDNLRALLQELNINWSIARRTGDTSQSERAKQKKRLPTVLVTTPESLSLLMSYKETRKQLIQAKTIVVDEWHELLSSKRGVQLELCLAHLRNHSRALEQASQTDSDDSVGGIQTWGLSATIGNTEQAMDILLGPDADKGVLIRGGAKKQTRIRSVLPKNMERFPWSGHLGLRLIDDVIKIIEDAESTLLFTNTRSQSELWYESILKKKPEWLFDMALHHGSIAKDVRDKVEQGLRSGSLKIVVCTSSLDLGVDFSPVDRVIQVGSPKGVARLMQRAGRSGHSPGRVSEVMCVPGHAFELVEIAAARRAAERGIVEERRPLTMCLDVLVQHATTLSLSWHYTEEEAYQEVIRTHAFKDLKIEQWQWVLDFITRGGDALQHYEEFKKVVIDQDGRYHLEDKRIARLHRMGIGTITSDGTMQVKFLGGGRLGSIEESFISKLKPDDCFLFAGRVLSLVQVRDMTAFVKIATDKKRTIPRWSGGRLPLSSELSTHVREMLNDFTDNKEESLEMRRIHDILALQTERSLVPATNEILIEKIRTREGHHIFIYPFGGRLVHEGLAALTAWRITQIQPATFTTSVNDYGFELLSKTQVDLNPLVLDALFNRDNVLPDVFASINESELAKRQFRDIARVAGLIMQGFPGAKKSMRQVQASSGLIYEVLRDYDSKNLLLSQALEEVLHSQLEITRLNDILARIHTQRFVVKDLKRLTPFAFPLWADRLRGQLISSEKWQDRVQRMLSQLDPEHEMEATH